MKTMKTFENLTFLVFLVKNLKFIFIIFWQRRPRKCVWRCFRKKTLWKHRITKVQKYFFSKGLVHGLGQKLAIFRSFYFRHERQGKCILWYFRKKNAFLDYKNKYKKVEELGFFHGFGQKLATFPPFYFEQNRPGMCVSRDSKKKKRLSRV